MRGKSLATAYFHGNKYRYEGRFSLVFEIFCCQRLFLEQLECWHVLAETKPEMWLLNLMHAVLLVRLGLFRELMGHEGVMEPLHMGNHGGFDPNVIEETSGEVNKYLKWVWGCLWYERSEYTAGVIHAGLQATCAWATLHIQIVQWPRIVSNK